MDRRWYLDVNRFARDTAWAHPVVRAYAVWGGIAVLVALLLAGWWLSRADGTSPAALWAGVGALVAVGVNQPVIHFFARPRPYVTIPGVLVLVARGHDFTFPSDHATAAGAVICGLALARRHRLAAAATAAGATLAFSRVYVGAHYPGDVAAGLIFGAAVVAVGYPVAMLLLRPAVAVAARSPLRPLVMAEGPGDAPPAIEFTPQD